MSTLISMVRRLANARGLLALIAAVVVAMLTIHVLPTPWSLVRLKALTGGVSILDMEPHYSAATAYQRLVDLGEAGRSFYLHRVLLGLDVVLPPLMALMLSVAIRVALGRGVPAGDRRERLALVPWLAFGLDYVENILIGSLLLRFPTPMPVVAAIAGWVTTMKLIGYWSGLVTIAVAWWVGRSERMASEGRGG